MKCVEMARHAPAYDNSSYIIPDTLTRFLEADPTKQGFDVFPTANYFGVNSVWGQRSFRFHADDLTWGGDTCGLGIARATPPASANQEVLVGFPNALDHLSTHAEGILAVRVTDGNNYYGVTKAGRVFKRVAGVETNLAFIAPVGDTTAGHSGSVLRLRIEGTTLSVRWWYAIAGTDSGATQAEPSAWSTQLTDADLAGPGNYFGIMYRMLDALAFFDDAFEFLSVADSGDSATYPRTWQQRRDWQSDGGENAVLLLELGLLAETLTSPTEGITGYATVSTRPYVTAAGDVPANATFEDIVSEVGDYTRRMSDQLTGKGESSHGNVSLINENGKLDHFNNYNWDGRLYKMWSGAQDWPFCDFTIAARGIIADIDWSEQNKLTIKMGDPAAFLANAKIATDRYVQGSPADLPDATVGRTKPLGLGYVFNATPELVNEALSEYQFNSVPSTALLDVRESGNSVLGSLASTDLANSKFRLGGSAAGPISCDFSALTPVVAYTYEDGVNTAHFDVQHLAGIAGAVAALSGLDRDYIDYANSDQLYKYSMRFAATNIDSTKLGGIFISENDGAGKSAADLLTELALSNGCFWNFNREGRLIYGRFDLPAALPVFTLELDDFETRSFMPVLRIIPHQLERLYARKNYTIQNQMAFVVTADLAALYAAQGVLSDYTPTETGLDTPGQHILAKSLPSRMTLITGADSAAARSAANAESQRLWNMYSKLIVGFQFKTKRYANEFEVGMVLRVSADRWGMDSGQNGQIIAIRESHKSRVATVTWATQLTGQFPTVDPTNPILGASDFGL